MIDLITSIIPWEWIGGAVAALVAVLGVWTAGRRSGSVRAENKGLRAEVEAHEVRNEVDNRIATEHDAHKRLRDQWSE